MTHEVEGDKQNYRPKTVRIATLFTEYEAEINLQFDPTLDVFFKKSFFGNDLKNIEILLGGKKTKTHLSKVKFIKYITVKEEENVIIGELDNLEENWVKVRCTFSDNTCIVGRMCKLPGLRPSDLLLMNRNDRFIVLHHPNHENIHFYINNDQLGPLFNIEIIN